MRVGDIEVVSARGRTTVSARVTWEDTGHPETRVYYDTESRFFDDISPDPTAFLVGLFLRAVCLGERRVHYDGWISPRLRDGLTTAMMHYCRWFGFKPIAIEGASGSNGDRPRMSSPRAASFLSGGVDSLTTLAINRRDYPVTHPASIRDVIFVKGLEGRANGALLEKALEEFAAEAGITLLPVFGNVI